MNEIVYLLVGCLVAILVGAVSGFFLGKGRQQQTPAVDCATLKDYGPCEQCQQDSCKGIQKLKVPATGPLAGCAVLERQCDCSPDTYCKANPASPACPQCEDPSSWTTYSPECPSDCSADCQDSPNTQVSLCISKEAQSTCDWSQMVRVRSCPPGENCGSGDAPSCSVSTWSDWSQCTPTAPSTRFRTRESSGNCHPDDVFQIGTCSLQKPAVDTNCVYEDSWGPASRCSKPCADAEGPGTSFQFRKLLSGDPVACEAGQWKVTPCATTSCRAYDGNDSAPSGAVQPTWPMVDAFCDYQCAVKSGIVDGPAESVTQFTIDGKPSFYVGQELLAANGCDCGPSQDCSYSDWSDFTDCTQPCWNKSGVQFRYRSIVSPSSGDGEACDPTQLVQEIACDAPLGTCSDVDVVSQDCQLSDWKDTGPCQPSCDNGKDQPFKYQNRSILQPAQGQGKPCYDFLVQRTVSCDVPSCDVTSACIYGPWPGTNDCDGKLQDSTPFFVDDIAIATVKGWLESGYSLRDVSTYVNSKGQASRTMPPRLAQHLNSGGTGACVLVPGQNYFSLTSGRGWSAVVQCNDAVTAETSCPIPQVLQEDGSCGCPSMCPWEPEQCQFSDCRGASASCGTGIQQMVRSVRQIPASGGCDPMQLLSQTTCDMGDGPCTFSCPVGCENGLECGGNGTCDYTTGQCQCNPGFEGPSCAGSCPTDDWGRECFGNGQCDASTFQCLCDDGYFGDACEKRVVSYVANSYQAHPLNGFRFGPFSQKNSSTGRVSLNQGPPSFTITNVAAGPAESCSIGSSGLPSSGCDLCFSSVDPFVSAAVGDRTTVSLNVPSWGYNEEIFSLTFGVQRYQESLGPGMAGVQAVPGKTCEDLGYNQVTTVSGVGYLPEEYVDKLKATSKDLVYQNPSEAGVVQMYDVVGKR